MARKALLVLTVVGLYSGTDIASGVALQFHLRWEYKGGVARPWLSEPGRSFERRPVSVCRERPVRHLTDYFWILLSGRTGSRTRQTPRAPQRRRRGKERTQLKREG